jgi:signal transduction histidine kinase
MAIFFRKLSQRPLSRSQREPLLVSIILLSAFVGMGFYIIATFLSAHTLREQSSLQRNATLAQLYAKIVASDTRDSLKLIHSLEKRFFSEKITLSAKEKAALSQYCAISPRIYQATILSAEGVCLYSTDPKFVPALIKSIPRSGLSQAKILPRLESLDNIPTFFTPIPQDKPRGYLVTSFRPEGFSLWLLDFQITGTQVAIVQRDGKVIVSTNSESRGRQIPHDYAPLHQARDNSLGAMVEKHPFINRRAIVGYAPIGETQWCLLVIQQADDTYREEDYSILFLTNSTAPFLLFLPFAAWITLNRYHKQLQKTQELAFYNERLHLADQAKSDLLANVSHDLKTPIASLQLSLASLRAEELAQHPERLQEYSLLLEQELGRLSSKVRNLLEMSRLEHASPAIPTTELPLTELSEVVADVLERVEPLLRKHPIVADFPEEPLFTECNPEHLVIVFMNLLENAVRYTPPGSPIQLQATAFPQSISVTIHDSGPGIPETLHGRIFEKFYRVPGQHTHGTGLGLAICKGIVEAQGGQLTVSSPASGGAAFTITLPRYLAEATS